MELIPYNSGEGREVVLRHRNALVVRDPSSQRLEIRGFPLTECPTCHQPLRARSVSPDRPHFDRPAHDETYVNPEYFRMLQAGYDEVHSHDREAPPSPIRRLTQPTLPQTESRAHVPHDVHEAEFISSTPVPQEGARIERNAYSPNYFKRFFVEERELGRGGKGVVLLVRHVLDGCDLGHFACKRVPVGDNHAWLKKVLIEVQLLVNLSHPNLVSYRHVWLEDIQFNRFGPSVACAFILQQYCNSGDLLHHIIGNQLHEPTKEQLKDQIRRRSKGQTERPRSISPLRRQLPLEDIYSLFRDIVSGLAYLHKSGYIHRDLKPSNCLLHLEGGRLTCLISDFGEMQPENAIRTSTGNTGTLSYCAPEVLKMDAAGHYGNFTTKSDIFSLGMILYFLCFSRLPYRNANAVQEELEDLDLLRAEISDWKGFHEEQKERPDLPKKLYQLLKEMLATNPAKRPSATEVLTMINHGSNGGGFIREPRSTSPSVGLRGPRIQNLDSPQPPSTPVPDPVKQSYRKAISDAVSGSPASTRESPVADPTHSVIDSLRKHPDRTSPRLRPHAMALSRSNDSMPSPASDSGDSAGDHDPTSPPLLMPPTTTFAGEVFNRAVVVRHQLAYLYRSNYDTSVFLTRLSLFLVKMFSVAKVCWPYMINLGIGATLVGIAAMDLGMPHNYEYPGGSRVLSSRWRWDWRVSSVLFLVHFAVLFTISRWPILCAMPKESWMVMW